MSHQRPDRGPAHVPALLAALPLLLGAIPGAGAADPLQGMSGRWAPGPDAAATVELAPSEDGFTLTWQPPERDPTTARFTATERPNVYAAEQQEGWSMFGGGEAVVNPLQEGTLLWARTAEDGVYVYSLEIDDRGGFLLDRYAYRPDGESLLVSLLRRTAEGEVKPPEQKLVKVDR
ncbi:MAG TPA: hypothetical protein VFY87_03610 [Geminicoccaceae bacterium]|nr:hypothetical protein [Geminicoccaceae bacterium]